MLKCNNDVEPAPEKNIIQGAEFVSIDDMLCTPYFQTTVTEKVKVPWLAQKEEATYLNRWKAMNEPPVKSYRELRFFAPSQEKYEKVEGFTGNKSNLFLILILIIIAFIVYKQT
jgi:hypothetical protein